MTPTIFTFMMSVIWCNIFVMLIVFLTKWDHFIALFSVTPLLFLVGMCIFRLLFFFEFPHTIVISSYHIFPPIMKYLETDAIWRFHPIQIAFIVWGVGAAYFIQRYIKRWIFFSKNLPAGYDISDGLASSIISEMMMHTRKQKKVKLIRSSDVTIPMVWGYFSPTIYLPDIPLKESELEHILLHEWTHFLHKDAWIKTFVCVLQAVFWWNPFIHILQFNLDHILELYCDARVVSDWDMNRRIGYLETISKIMSHHVLSKKEIKCIDMCSAFVLADYSKSSKIEQRFQLVLDSSSKRKCRRVIALLFAGVFFIYLISNLFVLQPAGEPGPDDSEEPTYSITKENAYLTIEPDGEYAIYIDGKFVSELDPDQIQKEPFSSLSVKQ